MNKILIIGQAPPLKAQEFPYDSTMFYDWLKEIGVSKEHAQNIFEFEAVSGYLRGVDKNGGHLKPTIKDMDQHWNNVLEEKVKMSNIIVLLGNVPKDYFKTKLVPRSSLDIYEIIHPSRRNLHLYRKNKDEILNTLKEVLKL